MALQEAELHMMMVAILAVTCTNFLAIHSRSKAVPLAKGFRRVVTASETIASVKELRLGQTTPSLGLVIPGGLGLALTNRYHFHF